MKMNADVSILVDYSRTAFKIYRLHVRSLDFIRQSTNRIRQSYRVNWPLETAHCMQISYLDILKTCYLVRLSITAR